MIKLKAVIPAAGLGTRFLPLTKAQPKEMLPVCNKPVIQYVVEEAVEAGIENVLPESFEEFSNLGLVKDGIYKRVEFAIENVFDICAVINADLDLGIPGSDEDMGQEKLI